MMLRDFILIILLMSSCSHTTDIRRLQYQINYWQYELTCRQCDTDYRLCLLETNVKDCKLEQEDCIIKATAYYKYIQDGYETGKGD
jgi:hypothetical protein